jgi:maltose alpha-D-glucosyltransferase/alpha-amylase
LYYGDEIAMGDNMYLGDRNGVRTPMQWSPDRNAGFSRTNPQRLLLPVVIDPEYHYEAVNVETQQSNPESLLWWMKRILALRKQFRAFGRGSVTLLAPKNPRVLAFLRRYDGETLLVVANFSRFVQHVELDLRDYRGVRPIELFGLSRLGVIGRRPYSLTIGPHGWYWLRLSETERVHAALPSAELEWPRFVVEDDWTELLTRHRQRLDAVLEPFIERQRWYDGKGRKGTRMTLAEAYPLTSTQTPCFLAVVEVASANDPSERYQLPLALSTGLYSEYIAARHPEMILGEVVSGGGEHLGLLHDAAFDRDFVAALCLMMTEGAKLDTNGSRLSAQAFETIQLLDESEQGQELYVRSLGVQQSNSSARVGSKYVLKILRKVEEGINPDLELGQYLTDVAKFPQVPATAGAVSLRCGRTREPATLAILQRFVANVGDAWSYSIREIGRFYRAVLPETPQPQWRITRHGLFDLVGRQPDPRLRTLIGPYFEAVRIMGQRTAQMHLCLAAATDDKSLVLEPFTTHYQRQLYQGFRSLVGRTLDRLGENLGNMNEALSDRALRLIERESEILDEFTLIRDSAINAGRIRIHGDYHLGQLLCTGNDFVIVDFEGEPMRALSERRIKRCPLRDVAGMLRSFHYAAMSSLMSETPSAVVRPVDRQHLAPWAEIWLAWVSASFLDGYLAQTRDVTFLPKSTAEVELLLRIYLLEKALYEVAYELGHRPDWVAIPLGATERLLASKGSRGQSQLPED